MKTIPLSQGKFAIVDDKDYEIVSKRNWFYNPHGYAETDIWTKVSKRGAKDGKRTRISLHRFIMNTPKGMDTDHINHDGLDNRKSNLRIVTHAENMANMSPHRDSVTGVKGVYIHNPKLKKKYRSRIMHMGKLIDLGCFKTTKEASMAYNNKARELNGELSYQQVN